jgi:hypothetical protein
VRVRVCTRARFQRVQDCIEYRVAQKSLDRSDNT